MRTPITTAKRIVVKVGTSTLAHENGQTHLARMEKLSQVLSDLVNAGKEIVLVSSGAVGIGASKMKLKQRPQTVLERQVAAAVGQSELMHLYSKFFGEYGHIVAQILLTRDVVEKKILRTNVSNSFERLLSEGIIPVVNENDPVATDEIEGEKSFGDNDTLSALVSELVHADCLIILSDIDGLYDKNPKTHDDAHLIHDVLTIDAAIHAMAGSSHSSLGTGGMATKIKAAEIASAAHVNMIIADGSHPEILYEILEGKTIGTWFHCSQ